MLDISQIDFEGGSRFIDGLVVLVGDVDDEGSEPPFLLRTAEIKYLQ